MTKKASYKKRLANPRWQRRRLEVLERAGWRCEWCGRGDEELQVHHGYYERERHEPWRYDSMTLYALCDGCHERAEKARAAVYRKLGYIHPKHYWAVYHLLKDAEELLASDVEALSGAGVEVRADDPEGEVGG